MRNLIFFFLFVFLLASCGEDDAVKEDLIYLAANGVTYKIFPNTPIGYTQDINGKTYTVVDETKLRQLVDNKLDISTAVTTYVTNMKYLLVNVVNPQYLGEFNQDISSWDVSNVTDMSDMFYGAKSFNQNIGAWDVSNVTDMSKMFWGAEVFNQDIGDWDVNNVKYMEYMFYWQTNFNQDIGAWDVSNVTHMGGMFGVGNFNQDISSWDVSNVKSMRQMFISADRFNQDIGAWDVSNVTHMGGMFALTEDFNQDLSGWNVNNVTLCGDFSKQARAWTLPKPNFLISCD